MSNKVDEKELRQVTGGEVGAVICSGGKKNSDGLIGPCNIELGSVAKKRAAREHSDGLVVKGEENMAAGPDRVGSWCRAEG